MGFFRRKSPPQIDPSFGDPQFLWLVETGRSGNWPAVRDFLSQQRDPRDLSFYLDAIAETEGNERWLADVIRTDQSSLALTVYGARLIVWAWEPRKGTKWAEELTPEMRALFKERLELAEQVLTEAVRRDPDNVAAWAEMVTISRGLHMGVEETMRRFNQAVSRCPEHMGAHHSALQGLCEKWGSGSHEMMFSFAREAMHRGRLGSELGELVVSAHLEMWGALRSEGRGYFQQPEIIQELQYAISSSIWHPQYRRRPDWPLPHNTFAMAFSLADQPVYAQRIFKVIGSRVTEKPWYMFVDGDPITNFTRWRDDMRI
jgi:hypothetical protein